MNRYVLAIDRTTLIAFACVLVGAWCVYTGLRIIALSVWRVFEGNAERGTG